MFFAMHSARLSLGLSLLVPVGRALAEGTASDADVQNVVAYEFEEQQVQGDLVAPLGEVLTVRNKLGKQSLVRARGSFIDKLVRAVENL